MYIIMCVLLIKCCVYVYVCVCASVFFLLVSRKIIIKPQRIRFGNGRMPSGQAYDHFVDYFEGTLA